eukprot:CAMPEP_0174851284 /NCGR_PEP_ID=MMETSP1114-20130205/22669_1 /TAXON_ID=312471 /ORGANISM="Neobodo designis, Strain CCAP 1951/1" /LENGTH=212 /DNA_ID=CAMNT_0016085813 /DNA_START=117 /DNA_END=755 /DNA_ORIENTATION=+
MAYAVLGLVAIHARRAHEHHAQANSHHHGPCPVEHFAWLALVTSLTGAAAACMPSRRRIAYGFVIVLLLAELATLAHISRNAARAVQRCNVDAERVEVRTTIERAEVAPSVELVRERVSVSEPFIDRPVRDQCVDGVRHASAYACLILGAICTSLMCCSSRMAAAVEHEEDAERHGLDAVEAAALEPERRPLTKPDPLEEYDEELATGKIAV